MLSRTWLRPLWVATALVATVTLIATVPRAGAEVAQRGAVRVDFSGAISPTLLPRHGVAPIALGFGGRIVPTDDHSLPQLQAMAIQVNRHGRLDLRGLPVCRLQQIQPSTTRDALEACGGALVGVGRFSAKVILPEQSPFPSNGKVLAFNGRLDGRPVLFAHVYGARPIPTSYVLPFSIERSRGTFGTMLRTEFPASTTDWGFVTGISITLKRSFRSGRRTRSYVSAGCPAPAGFPGAIFPLAKVGFEFSGNLSLSLTLTRRCSARNGAGPTSSSRMSAWSSRTAIDSPFSMAASE